VTKKAYERREKSTHAKYEKEAGRGGGRAGGDNHARDLSRHQGGEVKNSNNLKNGDWEREKSRQEIVKQETQGPDMEVTELSDQKTETKPGNLQGVIPFWKRNLGKKKKRKGKKPPFAVVTEETCSRAAVLSYQEGKKKKNGQKEKRNERTNWTRSRKRPGKGFRKVAGGGEKQRVSGDLSEPTLPRKQGKTAG